MIKVTELQRKNGKRTHDLGWRIPGASTKIQKLNDKGHLGWLKRCFEGFL